MSFFRISGIESSRVLRGIDLLDRHRLLEIAEQTDGSIGHDGVVEFVAQTGEVAHNVQCNVSLLQS